MKYIKTLYFLAQVAAVFMAILVAGKLVCVLCAALDPPLTALLAWMGDHALVGGLTVAIGFLLFWFGEECERQMRKERRRKRSNHEGA